MSGIDEAIAILKLCADDWSALTVNALYEGDRYRELGHRADHRRAVRERSPISRRCASARSADGREICTNAKQDLSGSTVEAGDVLRRAMTSTRRNQATDYAAMVGGVKMVSTEAQGSLFGGKPSARSRMRSSRRTAATRVKATKRFRRGGSRVSTSSRSSTTTTTA